MNNEIKPITKQYVILVLALTVLILFTVIIISGWKEFIPYLLNNRDNLLISGIVLYFFVLIQFLVALLNIFRLKKTFIKFTTSLDKCLSYVINSSNFKEYSKELENLDEEAGHKKPFDLRFTKIKLFF